MRIAVIVVCSVLALGCATKPTVIEPEAFERKMRGDLAWIDSGAAPIEGPLDLEGAIRRGLEHNLDLRLELRRRALAERELALSRWEMLPELVGNLGWNKRDEYQAASSISLLSRRQSLEPSFSQERHITSGDLRLSWNVLDFGVGWARSHQAADRLLIAEEERRKVSQQMVQDIRSAYWRSVSAERLMNDAAKLESRVVQALANTREISRRRLSPPLTSLTYERELIGIQRELQSIQRELAVAKIQLATLANVRPGQPFRVAVPEERQVSEVGLNLHQMENLALVNRPEIRNLAYEDRINQREGQVALFELLPRIELFLGRNYNSNNLLVHRDWLQYGANVSLGLIRAFSLPRTMGKIEAQRELLQAQRGAMAMAILTQVHVSRAMWEERRREYDTAVSYAHAQERILEQIRVSAGANRVGEQTLIREEMNALVAQVRQDMAFADLESAHGAMLLSLGVESSDDPTLLAAAEPEVTETAAVPAAPEVTETAAVPAAPEVTETAAVPAAPEVTETAALAAEPEVPETAAVSAGPADSHQD